MPGPIYAQQGSASQALVLTEKNEVPQDERPAANQEFPAQQRGCARESSGLLH